MLGERQRVFLIMSDEDHRPAERLLYLLELASDAHLQFHFQIRKRLIEQENIRFNLARETYQTLAETITVRNPIVAGRSIRWLNGAMQ